MEMQKYTANIQVEVFVPIIDELQPSDNIAKNTMNEMLIHLGKFGGGNPTFAKLIDISKTPA